MTSADPSLAAASRTARGSWREVPGAFLKLGLTSFGGPIAHLGYFREEFVVRRKWLDESAYADLVALCQFLPGPASSQVGFALGLMRGGALGAVAAWIAFTLPSAIALVIFALGAARGTNAAVVGLLGAALYQPVWTTTIRAPEDLALALAAFVLLMAWKAPPWLVVILTALGGIALAVT